MPTRLIQAKALLLLLVFLAAGTSLPSLDSLLFHRDAAESQRRIHVEPAGGCLDHAEHCVLGRTATGAGAIATLLKEVMVEPGNGSALVSLPTDLCRSYTRGGIHQPRAPPALRLA